MSMARRIELAAAVACLVLTAAAVFAVFGPTLTISTESSASVASATDPEAPLPQQVVTTTEHRSMYEDGVEPAAVVYIALMVGLAAGVLLLATVHGRSSATRSAAPLWSVAAAMLFLALIAGFTIGLFFVPAALAAILAAAAASKHAGRRPMEAA